VAGRLAAVLDREGPWIVDEPSRLRALLRDGAVQDQDEIELLVAAAELGIARELAHQRDTGVAPGRFAELAAELATRKDVPDTDARWAVDTWAWALAVDERILVFSTPAYSPPPRRPFRAHDHTFSLSFLAFVVATVAAIVVLSRSGPSPEAGAVVPAAQEPAPVASPVLRDPVPVAVGMTRDRAVASLQAGGFEWVIVRQESRKADPGIVLRQRPVAGAAIVPGSTVTLVVAVAPREVGQPRHLHAERTTTIVTLVWDAPQHGSAVDHYEIWRDGTMLGERAAGHRTFTEGGLTPGSTHRFGVIAVGENGTRTMSTSLSVTLRKPPPTPVEEPPTSSSSHAPPPPPPPPPDPCTAPDPAFCD
jgi:hypothetical protein